MSTGHIQNICIEIEEERYAQVAKWGQQDHESLYSETFRRTYEQRANHWKQVNDAREVQGSTTWDGILLEEVFEALAETDEEAMRAELVQVAAVAAAWIEAIDRRREEEDALDKLAETLAVPTDELAERVPDEDDN